MSEHTSKQFDAELESVRSRVLQMGGLVEEQIIRAMDAFARLDVSEAMRVVKQDTEVDDAFRAIMRQLITFMMEDPRTITRSLEILFIAKAVERIGDHAKNMAEYVVYMVMGRDVRHTSIEELEKELLE